MTKHTLSFYDFEGTVEEAIEMLQEYDLDANISVEEEPVYGYGGWTDEKRQFLVIKEKPKKKLDEC